MNGIQAAILETTILRFLTINSMQLVGDHYFAFWPENGVKSVKNAPKMNEPTISGRGRNFSEPRGPTFAKIKTYLLHLQASTIAKSQKHQQIAA